MIVLSLVDHRKSPRPSVLLSSYLFLTLLLDAAQARTLYLSSNDKPEFAYSGDFTAAVALKVGILVLEAQRKSRWVNWNEKEHSPEETSSIFSLAVFSWLNKIFLDGYKKILTMKDLYPLDSAFNSESLHEQFSRKVDYCKLKGDKYGLVKVLVRTLRVPLLLPVPPRLALLGFVISQPFFIESLLNHLSQPVGDANVGYGFIGASILIYSGIAISTALYWLVNNELPIGDHHSFIGRYFHHRMRTMARSILVTEIFIRATQARIETADDCAALTLMSTDMERIKMGLRTLHDTWASLIQAAVAAWMLQRRLGVVFVVPIAVVLFCLAGLGVLIKFAGDSQRAWMAGVQKRIGLTATVIASMKNLKLSGLSPVASDFVQRLRVDELAKGARFRKIYIIAALFGFIPMLLGPPLTFAFAHRTLDASRTFTSLAWLSLLTYPLSQLFQSTPELLSGLACLGRIQKFLECETHHDFREFLADTRLNSENQVEVKAEIDSNPEMVHPIIIQDGKFGWKADKFALRNINIQIPKSSLTIVVGTVGSGKSTLCKALLGEIPFSEGRTILSTRFPHIGFCDQVAFLSNRSIRDNIIGFSPFNAERYSEVIEATALGFDLDTLPQGDRTNVGSDGITLSGGQRHRVSLARALYLESDLLVLDDIFSGLDADTEEKVFQRVFGPGGLLRRRHSTVVLCTHSVRHLATADYIIALGEESVAEQGTFNELMSSAGYVQALGLKNISEGDALSERTQSGESTSKLHRKTTINDSSSLALEVDESRQNGDKMVYKHYFKSMGFFLAGLCLFFSTLWGFFTNFPTICMPLFISLQTPHLDMHKIGRTPANLYHFRAHILD